MSKPREIRKKARQIYWQRLDILGENVAVGFSGCRMRNDAVQTSAPELVCVLGTILVFEHL